MLEAIARPEPHPLERRPELPPVPERWEHIGGPAGGPERPPEPPRPVPLAQALKEAHHLTLLGEPGAGKTTTLQFVGLCFARPGWARARLELEAGKGRGPGAGAALAGRRPPAPPPGRPG